MLKCQNPKNLFSLNRILLVVTIISKQFQPNLIHVTTVFDKDPKSLKLVQVHPKNHQFLRKIV